METRPREASLASAIIFLVLLGSPAASGAGLGTLLAVVTGRSPVLVEVPADRNTTRPRLA